MTGMSPEPHRRPAFLVFIPFLAPFLAVAPAGCGYWKSRGKDFLDPWGVGFSRGRGFELNVRATHFLQTGLPYFTAIQPFQGVALHLDFNPYEIADLVLGFLTIDISGDDVAPETRDRR